MEVNIAQNNGGDIYYEEENGNTSFVLVLPLG